MAVLSMDAGCQLLNGPKIIIAQCVIGKLWLVFVVDMMFFDMVQLFATLFLVVDMNWQQSLIMINCTTAN